jgi:hypothetical protein
MGAWCDEVPQSLHAPSPGSIHSLSTHQYMGETKSQSYEVLVLDYPDSEHCAKTAPETTEHDLRASLQHEPRHPHDHQTSSYLTPTQRWLGENAREGPSGVIERTLKIFPKQSTKVPATSDNAACSETGATYAGSACGELYAEKSTAAIYGEKQTQEAGFQASGKSCEGVEGVFRGKSHWLGDDWMCLPEDGLDQCS